MTEISDARTAEAILDLVREVEREAPGGAETLYMAAMLADSPLPYDFVLAVDGTPHNPALVNPAAAFFAATAIMDPLVNRGLVEADADSQAFVLPGDVREVLRAGLDREQAAQWAGRAVYALNLSLPDADPQSWPLTEWLLPHIRACRDLAVDPGVPTAAANRVLHQAGFSLHFQGRHREAAEFLEAAMAVDVAVKGGHHPDIAADLEGLATVYRAGRDLVRAEATFRACLDLQGEIFTANHPATASVLNGLALVLWERGDAAGAEAALDRCLDVLRAAGEERGPAAADCLRDKALLLAALDRPEQGLGLAEDCLALTTDLYGEHHPETAAAHDLAGHLCEALGRDDEAETHFRAGVAVRSRFFGEDHPETGRALCDLALFLDGRGREAEALDCFERGFEAWEEWLGPDRSLSGEALDHLIAFLERAASSATSSPSPLRERAVARLKRIVEQAG